jgi:hypothetical protein
MHNINKGRIIREWKTDKINISTGAQHFVVHSEILNCTISFPFAVHNTGCTIGLRHL